MAYIAAREHIRRAALYDDCSKKLIIKVELATTDIEILQHYAGRAPAGLLINVINGLLLTTKNEASLHCARAGARVSVCVCVCACVCVCVRL